MRETFDTLRREDGITIVELLVVCLIGFVVLSAAAGLTESSGRSSARVTDEVEVAQRARLGMDGVTRQLRSQVCLDPGTPPIAAGTDKSITFYNDLDSSPDFVPERQRISYSSAGDGTILRESWEATTTAPPWTFESTPSSRTVLTHVGQLGDPAQPIFRYYSFEGSGALTTPLATKVAVDPDIAGDAIPANSLAKVVRVEVAFEVRPTNGSFDTERRASGLRSSVYLRNTDHSDGDPAAERTWGPRCD